MPERNKKMFESIARLLLKYRIQEGNIVVTSEDLKQLTIKFAKDIQEQYDRPILPKPGESIAVPTQAPKTAALFFDRVWYPISAFDPPPEEIAIYGATEFEIWLDAIISGTHKIGGDNIEKVQNLVKKTPLGKYSYLNKHPYRIISEALFKKYGFIATPVYESMESLKIEYQPGNAEVIIAAIRNIGIVDEDKLEWDQVEEFRKDSIVRIKYRRMIHWIDSEMVGKPVDFISDRIANKLEDYEWALKKHGIKTITGCLSRIIDPRFIGASTAALVGLTLAGGDQFLAAIGGLSLLAGKTAISITKAALDIIDRKRGKDSEVAFVYDMKKKLK